MAIKIEFVIEKSEKGFVNEFTNRNNSKRIIAIKGGLIGCLPNTTTAYAPIGGKKALRQVLDILIWL
jgi:hypothetical protein